MNESTTALVTGANKGIGRETARRLAALGMTVLVGARDRDRGVAAVESLRSASRDVHLLLLDVSDEASVAAAASEVKRRFGRLDVLVNNAATALGAAPPSKQSVAAMRTIFGTNVFGPLATIHAFLPLLSEAPSPRIVNVSSAVGSLALASNPESRIAQLDRFFGYSVSKTVVNALTLRLAQELDKTRVKVNAACPGFVATDLNHHTGRRSVEEGASIVVRLATLPDDGPTGGFFDDAGRVPW